jgi:cobalt/nickel transport system permease protein
MATAGDTDQGERMTHMHIPDGILPFWLWASGFLVMSAVLAVSLYRLRGTDRRRNIPLLGALAAAMLVAMSLEVLPIAYHLNLSVATGILLVPSLGFLAAFIVNLMLAFIGHGGITVIGLNTLLLGAEAMLGHGLFYILPSRLPVFWRAFLATLLSLFIVSLLLIAIVGISHVDIEAFTRPHGHAGTDDASGAGAQHASLTTFALLVLSLGSIGWIIEAAITGAVIRFLSRVKPDLLAHVLHAPPLSKNAGFPS